MAARWRNFDKIWLALGVYLIFVLAIVLFFDKANFFSWQLWKVFCTCAGVLLALYLIKNYLRANVFSAINIFFCYGLLTILYRQTAYTGSLVFAPVDEALIRADQWIFGFQPSLRFSSWLPQCFFSELFFFGYFSYYLMPLAVLFFLFRFKKEKLKPFGFLLISSFLAYYILFIFFPAVGPLFYYPAPLNRVEACGFFGHAIAWIQKIGEVPTGAFPSSHVGVSVIMLIWLVKHFRQLAFIFFPVVLILIFSTIYIKAHYAVDTIGGIVSAPLIYSLLMWVYRLSSIKKAKEWES